MQRLPHLSSQFTDIVKLPVLPDSIYYIIFKKYLIDTRTQNFLLSREQLDMFLLNPSLLLSMMTVM